MAMRITGSKLSADFDSTHWSVFQPDMVVKHDNLTHFSTNVDQSGFVDFVVLQK